MDSSERPIRIVQVTRSCQRGGTDEQVVELLRALPPRYHVDVAVLEEAGPLLETLWHLGHLTEEFALRGSLVRPNTALQIARMAAWLMQNGTELVHAHELYTSAIAIPAARLVGAKAVIDRADLARSLGLAERALLTQLTRLADHVVAASEAVRRALVESEGIAAERISVIRPGIDLARFDAGGAAEPRELPDTGGLPVIVHAADLADPRTRAEDLLAAISLFEHGRPRAHALLIGEGPRRPELERLAKDLGVSHRVHFLRVRRDVPALLRRARVGVVCSSEPQPLAVIAGMAAALPMVVSDVDGQAELVAAPERGLGVRPGRPVELARALGAILDAPEVAMDMGERGRAFVERALTVGRVAVEHDALYRRLARAIEEPAPREAAT